MMLWVKKYQPKQLKDIIGQKKAIEELTFFIKNFAREKKKAYLLAGPPGCGKTSIVYALAEEMNLDVVEMNASDFRNKDMIKENIMPATQQASLFGRGKLILIDEIDNLSGTQDRGGAIALVDVISETRFPIILTANDAYSDKLKTLRKHCVLLNMRKPEYGAVANLLESVLKRENIAYEVGALQKISLANDGDIRGAINDMQSFVDVNGKLTVENVSMSERFREGSIFDVLKFIFKSFDTRAAMGAVDDMKEDYDALMLWLYDAIPKEYSGKKELLDAYVSLSDAGIFQSRIIKWQHWRYLVYVQMFMVAGVQCAKNNVNPRFVLHQRPMILLKLWQRAAKRKKLKSLAEQIGPILHSSARAIQSDFLPFYEVIKSVDKQMGKKIDFYLGI